MSALRRRAIYIYTQATSLIGGDVLVHSLPFLTQRSQVTQSKSQSNSFQSLVDVLLNVWGQKKLQVKLAALDRELSDSSN
jgi:hypothetical protein